MTGVVCVASSAQPQPQLLRPDILAASGLRRQLFRFTPADPARQYPKKLVPLEEWLSMMKKLHRRSDPPVWIEASELELEDPPGTQGIWD